MIEPPVKQRELVRFLDDLFQSDVHAKRVQSMANATLGILTSGAIAIHAIGQGLAFAQGTMCKHGIKQVDRLLSNKAFDVWRYFEHWVSYVVASRREIVVALDWSSFDADGQETLMLSMLTSHGRATPLIWKTVRAETMKGWRAHHEEDVLSRLNEILPEEIEVTVIADRGFADCKLFNYLKLTLGFDFIIRIRGDYYVTDSKGEQRTAAQWVGKNGRARTLRNAKVTKTHNFPAGTVVCVQDKDMKDCWALVASDPNISARECIRYYAKRWGIETAFRDIKDMRFGLGLSATRIRTPARRDRLLLLAAFAVCLLSLLGAASERLGYDRHLKANTVKTRTHSLFRQGVMLYQSIPNMPEERLRPLVETFEEILADHPTITSAFAVI